MLITRAEETLFKGALYPVTSSPFTRLLWPNPSVPVPAVTGRSGPVLYTCRPSLGPAPSPRGPDLTGRKWALGPTVWAGGAGCSGKLAVSGPLSGRSGELPGSPHPHVALTPHGSSSGTLSPREAWSQTQAGGLRAPAIASSCHTHGLKVKPFGAHAVPSLHHFQLLLHLRLQVTQT